MAAAMQKIYTTLYVYRRIQSFNLTPPCPSIRSVTPRLARAKKEAPAGGMGSTPSVPARAAPVKEVEHAGSGSEVVESHMAMIR